MKHDMSGLGFRSYLVPSPLTPRPLAGSQPEELARAFAGTRFVAAKSCPATERSDVALHTRARRRPISRRQASACGQLSAAPRRRKAHLATGFQICFDRPRPLGRGENPPARLPPPRLGPESRLLALRALARDRASGHSGEPLMVHLGLTMNGAAQKVYPRTQGGLRRDGPERRYDWAGSPLRAAGDGLGSTRRLHPSH